MNISIQQLVRSVFVIVVGSFFLWTNGWFPSWSMKATHAQQGIQPSASPSSQPEENKGAPERSFVGPRDHIPEDTPKEKGFRKFAVPVEGVLARSGTPTIKDLEWLREKGWKSVINLRVEGEHDETTDDRRLSGFDSLGFNYVPIPIADGTAPTDQQGRDFLSVVTNPENQPVLVHCRGGIGRSGTMVALYRYAVQGWSMDDAIRESRLYVNGVSKEQSRWLHAWEKRYPPGSYNVYQ